MEDYRNKLKRGIIFESIFAAVSVAVIVLSYMRAVSYTHLTLPTNSRV